MEMEETNSFDESDESPVRTLVEHDTLLIETLGLLHSQIVQFDTNSKTPKTIGTGINCLAAGASVGSILGGLALAPITAGVSLGLAIGGVAGLVVGSGINYTTDFFKDKRMKEYLKHLELLAEEHDYQLKHLLKQLQAENSDKTSIVELFIKNYKIHGQRTVSPRNIVADVVGVTGKMGSVIDAREATKIPHVVQEITSSSASSAIATGGFTVGTLTLATGIAVTGAVASVGFAIWDVASLIKSWGKISPTADMVQQLKLEIEKEKEFFKAYFKL